MEVENKILDNILFELKSLKKEIKSIKKELKEENLSSFVDNLNKNNHLATPKEAKEVGLRI